MKTTLIDNHVDSSATSAAKTLKFISEAMKTQVHCPNIPDYSFHGHIIVDLVVENK